MLMSRPRTGSSSIEMADVHNYYERLVTDSVLRTHSRASTDTDFLADVSCVALNHLPPRYIRHDVDMSFFMSPAEREETSNKVQLAVDYALKFVLEHEQAKIEQKMEKANQQNNSKSHAQHDEEGDTHNISTQNSLADTHSPNTVSAPAIEIGNSETLAATPPQEH